MCLCICVKVYQEKNRIKDKRKPFLQPRTQYNLHPPKNGNSEAGIKLSDKLIHTQVAEILQYPHWLMCFQMQCHWFEHLVT